MDEQRQRIIEDLSGVFSGEIRCDDLAVAMYSSDASLFTVSPLGVAFPRDREDVISLVQYSSEHNLPLTARGAGTNVTGSCLGSGLIVDFSRHMRAIESIDESTVRVQPGVVLDDLNQELRKSGRYFAPDPSNTAVTTIGGMMGVDAAGSRAARVGSTRDHVVSLEMVVSGGHLLECGVEPLKFSRSGIDSPAAGGEDEAASASMKRTIISRLAKVLSDNSELIDRHQPAMLRNTSGYFLRGIHHNEELHVPRLLVGSEGTLGLFASATLHTSVLPEHRGVALLVFGQMEHAIDSVQAVLNQQLSACDLLDRRLLMLGRENDARFEHFIPASAEAGLLIEQTGFSERQCRDRIAMAVAAVQQRCPEVNVAIEAYDFDGVEFLWELPRRVVSLLSRMKGETRPLPFTEDVAVPPESLQEFFARVRALFQKFEVTSSIYSHAMSGQIHMRPFMKTPYAEDAQRISDLAEGINEIARSVGGTMSGEHGDGLSRSCFVEKQYGPLYSVFRQIKDIFDPHNLMSPGRIVTEETVLPSTSFRAEPSVAADLVQLQLNWDPHALVESIDDCNGCGICRTRVDELRMCPFFRNDPSEEASPRAKANVMRAVISGDLGPTGPSTDEFQALVSKCFNCRQCELECPTNVRIPQMMIEAKAQAVEASGIDRATWLASRAHSFGPLGCRFSWFFNPLLKNRVGRWLLEKFVGIHRHRKLPEFAGRPFTDDLPEETTDSVPDPRRPSVVYFVDHFANHHDPELAESFVAILEHHGFRVHIPGGQTGSGMAMISTGDLEAARKLAEKNVRELVEFAREGVPILCTEPAAALCLRDDYPLLLDHPDVKTVAEATIEAGAFLRQIHQAGELKTDLSPLPLKVGYHTPCHMKALNSGLPLRELLDLIPELELISIEKGCSGMAGTFGLTRDQFGTSLEIGRDLIERMQQPDLIAGATECSSCRLQMEQGTDTPTVHPIKLLAASYGLMPSVSGRMIDLAAAASNYA